MTKVDSRHSPQGALGQKYLASGVHVAMRLWEEEPTKGEKPESRREYETVGYVIEGRAELHLEGQMVLLEEGDSWVVPKGRRTGTGSWSRSKPSRPPRRRPMLMGGTSVSVRRPGRPQSFRTILIMSC